MYGAVRRGCIRASGTMQVIDMIDLSAPVTSSGMLCSSGLILLTSMDAVCCDGTGRYSQSHHSSLITMVGGVSPATMLREKATMWPSSAVLLSQEKGSFSIPHRTLMWRVGCVAMMRRAGRSFRGKDARLIILTALGEI